MKERIKLFVKYLILRNRAGKRMNGGFTDDEKQILNFLKYHIRQSTSYTIVPDNEKSTVKIIDGAVEFTLMGSRLVVIYPNGLMDIIVGELVRREINAYVGRVLNFRMIVFDKKCKAQVKKLIDGL